MLWAVGWCRGCKDWGLAMPLEGGSGVLEEEEVARKLMVEGGVFGRCSIPT